MPTPFDWTNRHSTNDINSSPNLNLTWTGGGSSQGLIVGFAGTQSGGTQTDPIFDAVRERSSQLADQRLRP